MILLVGSPDYYHLTDSSNNEEDDLSLTDTDEKDLGGATSSADDTD